MEATDNGYSERACSGKRAAVGMPVLSMLHAGLISRPLLVTLFDAQLLVIQIITFLPTCPPACLPARPPTCLPSCLPGKTTTTSMLAHVLKSTQEEPIAALVGANVPQVR